MILLYTNPFIVNRQSNHLQPIHLYSIHLQSKMEESNKAFSLKICQNILKFHVLQKMNKQMAITKKVIREFTANKSSTFTQKILNLMSQQYDGSKNHLNEDEYFPINKQLLNESRAIPFMKHDGILLKQKKQVDGKINKNLRRSIKSRITEELQASTRELQANTSHSNNSGFAQIFQNEVCMVPLMKDIDHDETSEEEDQDQEDFIAYLREKKINRQLYIDQHHSNKINVQHKQLRNNKENQKNSHALHTYDYDGDLIPFNKPSFSNKQHFLQMQVSLQKEPSHHTTARPFAKKNQKIQIKNSLKFDDQSYLYHSQKKDQLKVLENHFTKQFTNVKFEEGVSIKQTREECRKILGYDEKLNHQTKKKFQFLKNNINPSRIRFDQFLAYKKQNLHQNTQIGISTQNSLGGVGNKNSQETSKKDIFSKTFTLASNRQKGEKVIKVLNNKALEYLFNDQEVKEYDFQKQNQVKKSNFKMPKQGLTKSVHLNI